MFLWYIWVKLIKSISARNKCLLNLVEAGFEKCCLNIMIPQHHELQPQYVTVQFVYRQIRLFTPKPLDLLSDSVRKQCSRFGF